MSASALAAPGEATFLRDAILLRNEIVHPRDKPSGEAVFVGLEHIESKTGRRIGSVPIKLEDLTGRKARFCTGDIVYGYLRPYLNKVWLADFDGYCSVDQFVFRVRPGADAEYVALYMRSPRYMTLAPVTYTPGQLPRIRTEEVLSVPIPLPSIEDQHRIVKRAIEIEDQIRHATNDVRSLEGRLASLREAFLDQLFLGNI